MIVVDSMVQVYATTASRSTDLVLAVAGKDQEWSAPLLWQSEYRSAMLGLIRTGQLTLDLAVEAFAEAQALVAGRERVVETEQVLRLGVGQRLSAYDLEFVALARALQVPLVTFDREVLRAFPGLAQHPEQFLAG